MKFMKLNIQLFAVSASKSVNLTAPSASSSHYTLTALFSEEATSTTDNTSTIEIVGTLASDSIGSFSTSNGGTLDVYWYDNNENSKGKLVISKKVNSLGLSSKATYSYSLTVTHNSNGSLSGYVKTIWTKDGTLTYVPASGSVTTANTALTKIARATPTPSVTGSVGIATTIKLTRSVSSYTHTLRYTFGSLSNQTIATNVGTSYTWTMPTSFYAQIGSTAKSKTGTLYVDTYSGSTLIGTTSETFTANVDESRAKLTVSVSSVTDVNSATAQLTAGESTSSKIIRNASTARLTYSITSPSSATIKSVVINNSTASTSATYKDFSKISSQSFTIVATDSRGFTTTYSYTIPSDNWITYIPVTISGTVSRPDAISGNVNIIFSGNYWTGNFGSTSNTLTVQYRYKKTSASSWSSWLPTGGVSTTISGTTFRNSNTVTVSGIDVQSAYNFQFRAVDKVNTSGATYSTIVDKATSVMWWNNTDIFFENNINIQNAKVNNTDITASLQNLNNINDRPYIVEANLSENGYIRWSNGYQEAWVKLTNQTLGGTLYGNVYISDHSVLDWPADFKTIFSAESSTDVLQYWTSVRLIDTGVTVRVYRPNSTTATGTVFISASGTWK